MVANLLALQLINNRNINGIRIGDREFLLSQFADDTTLFLDGSKETLREVFSILSYFEECSGLKLNKSKIKAIWVKKSSVVFDEFEIDWSQDNFKILGIEFCHDLYETTLRNFTCQLNNISSLIKSWQHRKLTLMGKTMLIKQLCLSKFVHLAYTLHLPSDEFFKVIESVLFKFLWGDKRDKIARQTIKNQWTDGGLGFPDVKLFVETLRVLWVIRYWDKFNCEEARKPYWMKT